MKRRDADWNLHIAIVGLLITILLAITGFAYYIGNRDNKIEVNSDDISEIKETVKDNTKTLTDIYIIVKQQQRYTEKEDESTVKSVAAVKR